MSKPDIAVHLQVLPKSVKTGPFGLREDSLFTDKKGNEKSGIRKRAENALEKLREPLQKVLDPDEVILYVARAQAPVTIVEQLTMGWYIYAVTRCMLVLTNRRILQFLVKPGAFGGDMRWTWRGTGIRNIAWGDVAESKVRGWLSPVWHLTYRNGKKEKFWGLRGQDARKIRVVVEALLPNSTSENTAAQGPAMRCPACGKELIPGDYGCHSCGQQFKDVGTATRRSILIPGGGYFYIGEHVLGTFDAFFESILILLIALFFLEIIGVFPAAEGEPPASWEGLLFLLVVLAFEKLITIYHARKGVEAYIPAKS